MIVAMNDLFCRAMGVWQWTWSEVNPLQALTATQDAQIPGKPFEAKSLNHHTA